MLSRNFRQLIRLPRRQYLSTVSKSSKQVHLTISSEHPSRLWEARTPLTPGAVEQLKQEFGDNLQVTVVEDGRRCFATEEYKKAGARISTLVPEDSDLIFQIKEPPPETILSPGSNNAKDRTYVFFSHTHKGQKYNRGLLHSMLNSKSRFIDYELLTSPSTKQRTVAFGRLAGIAGALESLHALGLSLLLQQQTLTPLLSIPRPYMLGGARELEDVWGVVERVGKKIKERGLGRGKAGRVVVMTGSGKVANGVKEVMEKVGVEWIEKGDLEAVAKEGGGGKLWGYEAKVGDYIISKEGGNFEKAKFYSSPEAHTSLFGKDIAPYAAALINGAYWKEGVPRLISNEDLRRIQLMNAKDGGGRLMVVGDVSCDFEGGLEFVKRATTIEQPYAHLDLINGKEGLGWEVSSPSAYSTLLTSIEILPTSLPFIASSYFSSSLLPYVRSLISQQLSLKSSQSIQKDEISEALDNASVVINGKVGEGAGNWKEGMMKGLEEWRREKEEERIGGDAKGKKKVLLLGSGKVAGPAVEGLLREEGLEIVIGTNNPDEATELVQGLKEGFRARVKIEKLDISPSSSSLAPLVSSSSIVISLLPAPFHPTVAKHCISHKVPLVTASYVSDEMRALDEEAKANGVTVLGEVGLDPGIDHMESHSLLDSLPENSKINSFLSFCGGLPAPECADVPLGYKFSWSPRGALTAAFNEARWRRKGEEVVIPGSKLLASPIYSLPLLPSLSLESLANRNSLAYIPTYHLPKDIPTMLRGTVRFSGFAKTMEKLANVGIFDMKASVEGLGKREGWEAWLDGVTGAKDGWRKAVRGSQGDETTEVLEWLLSQSPKFPSLAPNASAFDVTCSLLEQALAYKSGERDMVLMAHEVGTTLPQGVEKHLTSRMVIFGDPIGVEGGHSAMARTVGTPVALAALLILNGGVKETGIITPKSKEIWKPLLDQLEAEGSIKFRREWRSDGRLLNCVTNQY